MYLLRMVEALQNDYPAVAHFLGDHAFADLVTRYCEAHPSVSYTLNRLGDRFPEFVASSRGVRRRAFLADLARLELAVTEVFDAPETPPLTAEAIAAVREDEWSGAVLEPIAALRALSFAYPVNAYLQSVKDDDHDHPPTGRKATRVVVWRKRFEVWRLDVAERPYALLGPSSAASRSEGRRARREGPRGRRRGADLPLAPRLGRGRGCSRAFGPASHTEPRE
jgi:hypothetical protein